jgi:tRNA/tmRNA/rRNA uracil-C5-methylase (TrmA/RlmC/RlmD family)
VDLGAGSGFVTTALAPLVASVHAVDISPAMTEALAERAADAGLANVSIQIPEPALVFTKALLAGDLEGPS